MGRKDKISSEVKIKYVEQYLEGKLGHNEAANRSGVSGRTFDIWVAKYKAEGPKGLHVQKRNKKYPEWLKKDAVEEYLKGGCSLVSICEKYAISSPHPLRNWIKEYNAHGKLKSSSGGSRMSKTRKTNKVFRILSECISVGT